MKVLFILQVFILSVGLSIGLSQHAEAATVFSGTSWLSSDSATGDTGPCVGDVGDTGPAWTQPGFDDSSWLPAFAPVPGSYYPPEAVSSQLMWAQGNPLQAFFRHTLPLGSQPSFANARLWADDNLEFYVNGVLVDHDRSGGAGDYPSGSEFAFREIDIAGYLGPGNNVLAVRGWDGTYCNVTANGGKVVYIEIEYEDVLPDWALTAINPEIARMSMSMAYDSDRQVVVMFGGRLSNPPYGLAAGTWEYDGTSWTQVVTANAPAARFWHAMAYDSNRQRVVLYGGGNDTATLFSETWEYDGTDWQQSYTLHSPPAMDQIVVAFDSHSNKMVLFGGQSLYGVHNDTWVYDGFDWSMVVTPVSPPPATLTAMVFDSVRNRMILFGSGVVGDPGFPDTPTWEFDGTNWTMLNTPTSPSSRWAHTMAYDSTRQRVVLFGGYGPSFPSGTQLNDTWEYDGFDWAQITPTHTPLTREQHGTAYDSARGRVVIFGGIGESTGDDTWEYIDELTPLEQVDNTLRLIDYAVADGSLEGSGSGRSSDGRLGALVNMIENAGVLVDDGLITEACVQLLNASKRTDGLSPPKDFVTGPAAVELEQLIQDMMESLDCSPAP